MTIIGGFKSYGGVALCADTQETIGTSKRHVPKLRFQPADRKFVRGGELAAAFCGATENGPFVDEVVERAWEEAQTATSLDEACREIDTSIKNTYREFGKIYQRGYCPTAELIYGVTMHGSSKLFYAYGPAISERQTFATGGCGVYLADFLAQRLHNPFLSLRQCAILAAYILFQAKEHVEGCGGESHIALLSDDAGSGLMHSGRVESVTRLLQHADQQIGHILMKHCDFGVSVEEFKDEARTSIESLAAMREEEREERRRAEEFWSTVFGGMGDTINELGLRQPRIKRSTAETSESEP